MVQHGPQTSEDIGAKIHAVRTRIALGKALLENITDLDDQVSCVRILAGTNGLTLNDNQIKAILQQQSCTVDEIMRLQTAPANPNTRLAVQVVLATVMALWKPGIPASILVNAALRQGLHGLFDQHLGLYNKAIELALMVATLGLGDYSVHSLSGTAITQLEKTYGRGMVTLAIPAAMMLYSKGPAILAAVADSKTVEVAGDFFDLMYGRADDEVYEKYHDSSLATMTMGDMTSSVMGSVGSTLSWMWNKVPSLRSHAPSRLALPDAATALSTCTQPIKPYWHL